MELKFTDIEKAAVETAKMNLQTNSAQYGKGFIGCLILFCWPGTGRIFP